MFNRRRFAALVIVAAAAATRAARAAQNPTDAAFAAANQAWDEGNYIAALESYIKLVTAPDGAAYLDPIALTTGELYQTEEIAADARGVARMSPDGRFVAYQTTAANAPAMRLVTLDGRAARSIELPVGAVLDPAWTKVVYLKPSTASKLARDASMVTRELDSGSETDLGSGGLAKTALTWHPDGRTIYFLGQREGEAMRSDVYAIGATAKEPRRVTSEPGIKSALTIDPSGSRLAYVARDGDIYTLASVSLAGDGASPATIRTGRARLDAPAFSPDGLRIAYQMMPAADWEIWMARSAGDQRRITREIQHDVLPRFVNANTLLAVMGEPRHRRSYLYDVETGRRTRLFHNNTVRTIAPEYGWEVSRDGRRVLITADRDGNTISPARGVYMVHLDRKVTRDQLLARLKTSLAAEQALRAQSLKAFEPIAARVREAVGDVSVSRIYGYEKALFEFDSKHISQPGNRKAIDYLDATYRSFGYEAQPQWFDLANAMGGRTANVLATLRGTEDPDLVYIVSSHFDSVAVGPGADDDTSGTAALLEAARVLANRPQPATIVFASLTGEESGLLGSREWVRQATANKIRVAGALNNDMIGMATDHRLDNTIRYSNDGIRDIQHGAAMLFTRLITYDSRYYQSTDAQAFYDAWGDIVGGIGSYPILGNPHYHQATDTLDTINHQLVAETSRTTVASIMRLASSPSRVTGLTLTRGTGDAVQVAWSRSPESAVDSYVVAWGPAPDQLRSRVVVRDPRATLRGIAPGTHVAVKAVNRRKLESWDWARGVVR